MIGAKSGNFVAEEEFVLDGGMDTDKAGKRDKSKKRGKAEKDTGKAKRKLKDAERITGKAEREYSGL